MVDADEFVDGSDVDWGRLSRTILGSTVLAIIVGFSEALQTLIGGLVGLVESGLLAVSGLWSEAVGILVNGYDVAVASFREGVVFLGPFAVPVAFVSVVGILLATREVVARVGV